MSPRPAATVPKIEPVSAPKTRSGKKIPPGTPEPKLIMEKINLTISRSSNILIVKEL